MDDRCQALQADGRQCSRSTLYELEIGDGMIVELCEECLRMLLAHEPVYVVILPMAEEHSN